MPPWGAQQCTGPLTSHEVLPHRVVSAPYNPQEPTHKQSGSNYRISPLEEMSVRG